MKMPDFKEWSLKLTAHHTVYSAEDVELALKQAFEQGYHLGLNQGWADQMDKEYNHKEGGTGNV